MGTPLPLLRMVRHQHSLLHSQLLLALHQLNELGLILSDLLRAMELGAQELILLDGQVILLGDHLHAVGELLYSLLVRMCEVEGGDVRVS